MEGSLLDDYITTLLVFMDHSNRSSNSVNHQTKKERSVHGKPEASLLYFPFDYTYSGRKVQSELVGTGQSS